MDENNRFAAFEQDIEPSQDQEARANELYEILKKQFDPANAKATNQLRKRLLQACKGLQVSEGMRKAMLQLGYDQDTPLEQQME